MGLISALFFGSVCLAVILRKQWMESERISFPILRPVTDLTERAATSDFPRLFWIGFAVAFGILAWNMIHYFVPGFPQIPNIQWGPWIRFERYFPGLWTRINMFTISFCYFANIDVLFSLWFFDLLFIIRSGILNRLGINASSWSHASADFQWVPLGAFFAMVGWGFWTSRSHLRLVFMKALGRDAPLDDKDEMMSFRTAVFGLIVCILFAVFWWWQAGMGLVLACAFVLAAFILYLGVSRIVSDVGLVFISMPVGPQRFVTSLFGSRNLSGSSLTTLGFTNGIASYGKGLFMPSVIHGAKLADVCPRDGRRRVLAALLLAFGLGCIFSVVFTLYLGYTYGAYNFNDWPFTRYSKSGFGRVLTQMNNPEAAPPDAVEPVWHRCRGDVFADIPEVPVSVVALPPGRIRAGRYGDVSPVHRVFGLSGLGDQISHPANRRGGALPPLRAVFSGCARRLFLRRGGFVDCGYGLVSGWRALDPRVLIHNVTTSMPRCCAEPFCAFCAFCGKFRRCLFSD